MTGRMAGKRAIITGGANGLGAAIAQLFAAEGARVVIADLDRAEHAAASVIADIERSGGARRSSPSTSAMPRRRRPPSTARPS